jgi:HSP20 family protein
MWGKRRPSVFDMFENFGRGFPFGKEQEEWFRSPFDDLIKKFEDKTPEGYESLVTEEETPLGLVRRYGPFVYGFSYTAEPGKEPVFQEFGNVRPSSRGILPSQGREPLVDIMDVKDKYKIFVELPGVDKEKVKLDVAEDSVEVKTEDDKNFYKMINLESPINTDSSKASYKNGVLTLELEKKEKRTGKEIKIE